MFTGDVSCISSKHRVMMLGPKQDNTESVLEYFG